MKFGGILRETVVACAACAGVAAIAASAAGHLAVGLGLAAGLVLGAFNAHAIAAVLDRKTPFVVGTILRLVLLSGAAIAIATLTRADAWAVLLGVGFAQVLMVVASIRQGLRS